MDVIRTLMTPQPLVVATSASIVDCAILLTRHGIRHLPVVDGDGALVGVVYDFDVFRHGALTSSHPPVWVYGRGEHHDLVASDIYENAEIAVSPDEPLASGLARLAASPEELVVVVDGRRHPIGVATEHDGVRFARAVLEPGLLVGDRSSRPLYTLAEGAPATAALDLMRQHRIRHVVLSRDGVASGVVSYRDLHEAGVQLGTDRTAGGLKRYPWLETVRPDTSLLQAADTMVRARIGCLPVVEEDGRPVGVLTRTDLVRAAVEAERQRP